MFRMAFIREHVGRAGRVVTASGAALPGPLGLLVQLIVLLLVIGALVLLALPLIVIGGALLVGGACYAGLRALLRSARTVSLDDGRRNVRVIARRDDGAV